MADDIQQRRRATGERATAGPRSLQWLKGETTIEPHGNRLGYPFNAKFLLVSKRTGRHTLSARYDRFDV